MGTLYDVLGVSPRSSPEEVRRAYYDLVRALHPDHHHGVSPDPVRLNDVNEAWRVLRDPVARASYDRSIEGQRRVRKVEAPRPTYQPQHAAPPGYEPDLDTPIEHPLAEPGDVGVSVVRGLPWVAVAIVLAVIFVFTAFAGRDGSSGPRDLIGKCVSLAQGNDVDAVPCEGPNDGEVVLVVERATSCPDGTDAQELDAQWLCVEPHDRTGR